MQNLFGETTEQFEFLSGLAPEVRVRIDIAYSAGIGDEVRQLYMTAAAHLVDFSAHKEAVVVAPSGHPRFKLLQIEMRPVNGRIRVYVYRDEIPKFYRVKHDEVNDIFGLGKSAWTQFPPDEVETFTRRIDRLFALHREREAKALGREVTSAPNKSLPTSSEHQYSAFEGRPLEVTLTVYERNRALRELCIRHYGAACRVCGFDFEATYGELGKGFIHVHHVQPLAEVGEEHLVDAIDDLRPVCPNCHAMLHQRPTPFSIEELQAIMASVAR